MAITSKTGKKPFVKVFKKRYLFAFGILVCLFVVWKVTQHTAQPTLETHSVSRQNITQLVSSSGNVKPSGKVEVYSTTDGVVDTFFVENGQYVEAGQELFAVVSTATPAEKATALAAVTAARQVRQESQQEKYKIQSELESARKAILDAQEIVGVMEDDPNRSSNYTSEQSESVYSSLTSARQSFSNAEQKFKEFDTKISAKSLDEQAKQLAYKATLDQVVVAAVPGTIANIGFQVGEEVFVETRLDSLPVLTLSDFNSYSVETSIKEADIFRLKSGQAATVILDVLPETTFEARVFTIDSLGETENGLVSYTVVLNLLETDTRIRPGMTANVEIVAETKNNVVSVPNDYLRTYEGVPIVYVATNDTPERKEIVTGIKSTTHTEIVSGLKEGETIVKMIE